MKRSRTAILLALLVSLALGFRVWVVLALRTEHTRPLGFEHARIAENLLAGRGFSIEFLGQEGPTSQQAPFYPLLLAGVYACFGVGTPQSLLCVELIQCVAGTALVLAVVWLGWSLVPDRRLVGWLAGLGAAVVPTHLYMVTHLQVALWAALLLTLLLAVVVSPRWQGRWAGALLAGLLAGLVLLVEPILALTLPICATAFWLAEPHKGVRLLQPAAVGRVIAMAGVAALVIMPWTVRNWLVHGQPVFIKSTFGYAFWQGNNPQSWGTDKIPKPSAETIRLAHDGTLRGMDHALWEARHETLYIDDVLLKPGGYREFAGLSEPQRSARLGREAWQFIVQHPARYGKLCLQRLRYFLLFDETNPKAANRLYRVSTVAWLVLAFIGLIVSSPRWRRLWPTYAVFAVVLLFHSLVIVSARFRIPIEPLSLVWIAAGLAPLANSHRVKVWRPGERPRDPFEPGQGLRGPHYRLPLPTESTLKSAHPLR
jgi:hypothetical protein